MLFEYQSVEQTKDTLLAHSMKLADRTLKKGHILTDDDIRALRKQGYDSVAIVRLEDGDIGEDKAAGMLAAALKNHSIEHDQPATGRCNLYAASHGLLTLNYNGIDQFNQVHESLTIATLAPFSVVKPKQMLATIKIIPFAVQKAHLGSCLEITKLSPPLLQVNPFKIKKTGFIQTRLPGMKESILEKTSTILAERLNKLDCEIHQEIRCQHDVTEISNAIDTLFDADSEIVLIIGASAIVDRRDVIPVAIENSGGHIIHFGMPADPGNLLLLAENNQRPVLGLPGCARSPKRNGFDMVLERLLAEIPVTSRDIMAMGQGGLFKA